jgi:beta propeller repeat protein
VSGNTAVWLMYKQIPTGNDYTASAFKNLSTGAYSSFRIGYNPPRISGTRAVYQLGTPSGTLFRRDLVAGTDLRLPTGDQCEGPAISGTRVAYQWRNTVANDGRSDADIAVYDLATGTDIFLTRNTAEQGPPSISGTRVVYADKRNGNWDIYMFDLVADREVRITSNTADQYDPAISGNRIVWTDKRNGNADIYMYDISANSTHRITTDVANQYYPDISGDRIVWVDVRNGDDDIYMATIAVTKTPTVLTLAAPSTCAYSGPATITGMLKTTSGVALSGKSVTLQKSPNGTTWSSVKAITTSATGAFSVSAAPTVKTYYRVSFAGDATRAGCTSPVRSILPRVSLATPAPSATAYLNRTLAFSGYLKPRHTPGVKTAQLQFYRSEASVWVYKKTVYATNWDADAWTTYYDGSTALSQRGSWRVRAYHPADTLNAATWSGWRTFTVY